MKEGAPIPSHNEEELRNEWVNNRGPVNKEPTQEPEAIKRTSANFEELQAKERAANALLAERAEFWGRTDPEDRKNAVAIEQARREAERVIEEDERKKKGTPLLKRLQEAREAKK
jgi:hypothetical protein